MCSRLWSPVPIWVVRLDGRSGSVSLNFRARHLPAEGLGFAIEPARLQSGARCFSFVDLFSMLFYEVQVSTHVGGTQIRGVPFRFHTFGVGREFGVGMI